MNDYNVYSDRAEFKLLHFSPAAATGDPERLAHSTATGKLYYYLSSQLLPKSRLILTLIKIISS